MRRRRPRRRGATVLETLTNAEIEDRFFVEGRMAILGLLHELIHRREHLNVRFGAQRGDFLMTILLAARPEGLIFDIGSIEPTNARLLLAKSCIFVGAPDGVRVQFSTGPAQRVSWGGQDAFLVPLPTRAIRLQRRETFRVATPIVRPLVAYLLGEQGSVLVQAPVHDIAVGGAGLAVGTEFRLEAGAVLPTAVIDLPELGRIQAAATVRHVTELSRAGGGVKRRAGLRFDGLPRAFDIAIQRYVVQVEHDRRRLARDD